MLLHLTLRWKTHGYIQFNQPCKELDKGQLEFLNSGHAYPHPPFRYLFVVHFSDFVISFLGVVTMKLCKRKLRKLVEQGNVIFAPSNLKRKKMDKGPSRKTEETQPCPLVLCSTSEANPATRSSLVVEVVDMDMPCSKEGEHAQSIPSIGDVPG